MADLVINDAAFMAKHDADTFDLGNKISLQGELNTVQVSSNSTCPCIPLNEINIGAPTGAGRFGVVFRTNWNDKIVAVKLVKDFNKTSWLLSFQEELVIWGRLRHTHIVQLFGYVFDCKEQIAGFVMEACDSSLHDCIHSENAIFDVSKIAQDIVCGLEYLHNNHIVHCDVKPRNILLSQDCRVAKLCDFGGCVEMGSQASEWKAHTTPHYMAPELFVHPAEITPYCDIYSFGVVLWEMVERKYPFKDMTDDEVSVAVRGNVRPKVSKCFDRYPASMKDLVLKCWDDNKETRPKAGDVSKILVNVKVASRCRRRWWIGICVLLTICLTVILCSVLLSSSSAVPEKRCTYGNILAPCIIKNVPAEETNLVKWQCSQESCDLLVDIQLPGSVPPFSQPILINAYRSMLVIRNNRVEPRTEALKICLEAVNAPRAEHVSAVNNFLGVEGQVNAYDQYSLTIPRVIAYLYLIGKCPAAETDVHLFAGSSTEEQFSMGFGGMDYRTFRIVPTRNKNIRTVYFMVPYFGTGFINQFRAVYCTWQPRQPSAQVVLPFGAADWQIYHNTPVTEYMVEMLFEGEQFNDGKLKGTFRFYKFPINNETVPTFVCRNSDRDGLIVGYDPSLPECMWTIDPVVGNKTLDSGYIHKPYVQTINS
mmetsp:Transcript_6378/g.10919  ORF Transcript_6378/g.10919 Transcript_6378/m.10919 type:complete len:650 (+) Transcript_6378:61-2010(+)